MSSKKVLLVDDDADDRDLFTTFYSNRIDLTLMPSVENGVDLINCLHQISSEDALPDLIIIDQNMPKMNGIQTLAFLKSSKRYAQIQAVIYSTYADSTLVHECLKLGAGMVAIKPIDRDGYEKMMDDFLGLLPVK